MQRLLNREAAARYLGVSLNVFDPRAKPDLRYINMTGTPRGYRWDVRDLDHWIDQGAARWSRAMAQDSASTSCSA